MDPLDLSGLVVARLCHDLAGSVGVLINGAELLADETDERVRADFLGMMAAGAKKLAAQLRFSRLAYGGGDAPLTVEDARQPLLELLASNGRVTLGWLDGGPPLERTRARLLLVLASIAADALDRGGRVTVGAGPLRWWVTAGGSSIALPPEQAALLRGDESPPAGSREAPARMALALAARIGVRIGMEESGGGLRLEIEG